MGQRVCLRPSLFFELQERENFSSRTSAEIYGDSLDVMTRSVGSFSYIFLLLLLFMFIFTILGMQLFSGYKLQNRNTCSDFGVALSLYSKC